MKWLKAIILVIIVIIIIILLLIINLKKDSMDNIDLLKKYGIENLEAGDISPIPMEKATLLNSETYFSVDSCARKLTSSVNSKKTYYLLNKEYKKNNNITEDNVLDITKLNKIQKYKTIKTYWISEETYTKFYLQGVTNIGYIYLNINFDYMNSSFDFSLLSQDEFENIINSDIDVKNETIEKNTYNSIPFQKLSEEERIKRLFYDFVDTVYDFPEVAYNSLDEEYRNAKFNDFEEFTKYMNNNKALKELYNDNNISALDYIDVYEYENALTGTKLESYNKEKHDDYTRYIFVDSYDNYYIFKVTSIMQYTVILDSYTIDIPEFTEKYDTANSQEKVVLNINKFNLALNDHDYKYAYSVLADSFKQRNFPTLADFEKYAKANFFDNNKFEYKKFNNENESYYTYDVVITDGLEASSNQIEKTFIMQLGDGKEFKMSFNLE